MAPNPASRIRKTLYCCRLDSQDYAKPYSGHNFIPATRALWDVRDFQLNTGIFNPIRFHRAERAVIGQLTSATQWVFP
jgi:hypothetical protein